MILAFFKRDTDKLGLTRYIIFYATLTEEKPTF
jgi:hypothetical protein